jgi:hypothetical protein
VKKKIILPIIETRLWHCALLEQSNLGAETTKKKMTALSMRGKWLQISRAILEKTIAGGNLSRDIYAYAYA